MQDMAAGYLWFVQGTAWHLRGIKDLLKYAVCKSSDMDFEFKYGLAIFYRKKTLE